MRYRIRCGIEKSIRHKKNIKHKRYIKPAVITYPEEAILDLICPANAAGSFDFHSPLGHSLKWIHGKGHNT